MNTCWRSMVSDSRPAPEAPVTSKVYAKMTSMAATNTKSHPSAAQRTKAAIIADLQAPGAKVASAKVLNSSEMTLSTRKWSVREELLAKCAAIQCLQCIARGSLSLYSSA